MQLQLRPSETFQELVKHSGRDFTPTIYELLAYIEKPQDMEGTRVVPDAPVLSAKKKEFTIRSHHLSALSAQMSMSTRRRG
jgi:hypothetical protein